MNTHCEWNRDKVYELYTALKRRYSLDTEDFIAWKLVLDKASDFEILVGIVLSQNTSDRNALRAFRNLKTLCTNVTPQCILELGEDRLRDAIRPAGMHTRRARLLIDLAKTVLQDPGIFERVKGLDPEQARKELLKLPGIGFKTADVYLLMVLRKPTFPIDTHINRIVRRLGIVGLDAGYEDIRRRLLELVREDIDVLRELHLLLIQHGRETCRTKAPRCDVCVVRDLCCRIGV